LHLSSYLVQQINEVKISMAAGKTIILCVAVCFVDKKAPGKLTNDL
jgi:hypothetical protein